MSWKRTHPVQRMLPLMAKANHKVPLVIDLGAGEGVFADVWNHYSQDTEVVLLDVNPESSSRNSVAANNRRMPFRRSSLSAAIAAQVLHYLEDHSTVLEEIFRTIQDGGFVLIVEYRDKLPWVPYPFAPLEHNGVDYTELADGYRTKYSVIVHKSNFMQIHE